MNDTASGNQGSLWKKHLEKICLFCAKPIPAKAFPFLLLAVTAAGFFLRLLENNLNGDLDRDSVLYINIASGYINDSSYPGVMLPFLTVMMKYLYFLGIPLETGGLLVSLLTGTFLIPLVYGILAQFCPRKEIPLAGALLTAFHPTLLQLSGQIMRDPPYLFFGACSILLFLLAVKKRKEKCSDLFWGIQGGVLALGCCCRYETVELIFLPVFYGIYAFAAKKEKMSVLLRKMGILLIVFLGVLFLFLYVNGLGNVLYELYIGRIFRIWQEHK